MQRSRLHLALRCPHGPMSLSSSMTIRSSSLLKASIVGSLSGAQTVSFAGALTSSSTNNVARRFISIPIPGEKPLVRLTDKHDLKDPELTREQVMEELSWRVTKAEKYIHSAVDYGSIFVASFLNEAKELLLSVEAEMKKRNIVDVEFNERIVKAHQDKIQVEYDCELL